tara:strand:- start:58 stop:267 length:210 start_codon:yes stop_codon:yes gene_type:complete
MTKYYYLSEEHTKKYTRYGVSDIVVHSKIRIPKWVDIKDVNGDVVACVEVYYICDEDENGEEILEEENK